MFIFLNKISSFDAAQFLSYLPIIKSHEFILMRGNEYDCPEIGSLQDLLEDTFLSQLTEAIDHLDKVVGEGFVFTITPEMMGDDGQSPINLDDTEIYLIKGVFHQLRALIYAVITYNVDIPYYDLMEEPDSTYNFPWLAQDASFLTIRSGQEQSLPNAHADLNAVLSSLESAITFLQSDTDTENDLIQLDEGELTELMGAVFHTSGEMKKSYKKSVDYLTTQHGIYKKANTPSHPIHRRLPIRVGQNQTRHKRLQQSLDQCGRHSQAAMNRSRREDP